MVGVGGLVAFVAGVVVGAAGGVAGWLVVARVRRERRRTRWVRAVGQARSHVLLIDPEGVAS